ncbi:MAG TPA: amino acid adenylation domain-containing protein, partial [Bryobacteraceae bacterium]
ISRHRATTSGGPNFAYDLCVRRIPEERRAALDLSSWKVAFNGAEPVRHETLQRFVSAFAAVGFHSSAFYPCYGLAESTLMVSAGRYSPEDGRVDCGRPECSVSVVDPESGCEVSEGDVGEIWVSGPSVAQGYWQREEETGSTFGARLRDSEDRYLRTGDLGMLRRGKLFVTGRLKDLIIVRGRNYYPSDIEAAVERCHFAFQGGMGGAFSIESDDEERVVAIQEAVHTNGLETALTAARAAVAEECGLHLHEIVLVRAGTLPRTTSGKVRRGACRDRYREGRLSVLARSAAAQPVSTTDFDSMTVEELLAACAARRLGIPVLDTDYDTPLISLGLDSLRAVELRNDIEELVGLSLPVGILLQGAGIREAARQLVNPPVESVKAQPSGVHCLSAGQRALWFLQTLNPESSAYHIGGAGRIRGPLDVKVLRAALQSLVDRHPALRTSFHAVDGDPVQEIHERAALDFHAADATTIAGQMSAAWAQPFRLDDASLVRARLFRESAESHILVLVIHHIVADYTSLQILLRELGGLHESWGGPPGPRPTPSSAPSQWEEIDLVGRRAGPGGPARTRGSAPRLLDYWLTKLANPPAPLQIPADRARPAVVRNVRGKRFLKLPASAPAQLRSFCRKRGVTPFMGLLAVFKVLLHRYTGERDLIVGTPVNVRTASESDIIGYCVNPVALRTNIDPAQTFEALLDCVKQTALEAFEHQDYPFGALVERLASARNSDATPVFQTMFVYHGASAENPALPAFALGIPGAQGRLGALELESVSVEGGHAQFDLTLSVADMKNDIDLAFDYDTDIFDAATVDRMLGHFANLLEAALAGPSQTIGDLPLLGGGERHRILREWNGARIPLPNVCVHELFEAQVRSWPDREALVQGANRWSYRELNSRADRLAHRLRQAGVGPEVTVGIFLDRSPHLVVALLAVWKAGGAYVPLDPAYPQERLRFAIEDAAPRVVLSETSLLERLPSGAYTILNIVGQDGILRPIGNRPVSNIPDPAQADYQSAAGYHPAPHNLAYLIYTSGSTGRPKAVAMEHRAAVALIEWAGREFSAAEMAGVLASTSINFDLSVFELFAPLCHGGKIILAANALDLPALAERGEVTLLNTVPSVMRELLDAGGLPATLRVVNLAGEALSGDLARRIRVGRLLNLYGPSESATYSTFAVIDAASEGAPPIGRPLPNVQTYVLDERLNPVPVGVAGELFVAGDGLARGYFRRAETTAERFIPNPFSDRAGARMYRTGDLARFRSDGNLDYLGRSDYQVKVRGFRIELGEIEAALRDCDGVADAVVIAREKQLIGYFVPGSAPAPVVESLIRALRERLPVYMVPAILVPLASFPLTPNGKLDRQALPLPDWTHAGSSPAAQSEYSFVEWTVAGLWSELLPVQTRGLDDDFFALGGHSLMAARLASRVRDTFQIAIPLRRLFECSTLRAMASEIEKLRAGGSAVESVRRLGPDEPPPLSFAQERMWVQQALAPASAAYHMPGGIRLSGPLDVKALRASLEQVIRRHETLRSRVPVSDGQPRLAVMEEPPDVFSIVNLSGLPSAQREIELRGIAQRYATLPFDFVTGPLLRVVLVQLDAAEHVLIAVLHHFVADGWSLEVLRRDLAKYYGAFLSGAPPAAAEPAIRYRDYAAWQRARFSGEHLERESPGLLE